VTQHSFNLDVQVQLSAALFDTLDNDDASLLHCTDTFQHVKMVTVSVCSEKQMICIWSSWCHCHHIISCSSKIENGLPFWRRLTQVVLEKRTL